MRAGVPPPHAAVWSRQGYAWLRMPAPPRPSRANPTHTPHPTPHPSPPLQVPDVEAPGFWPAMDRMVQYNDKIVEIGNSDGEPRPRAGRRRSTPRVRPAAQLPRPKAWINQS